VTDSRFRLLMLVSLGLLLLGTAANMHVLYGSQPSVPDGGPAWSAAASVGAALSLLYLVLYFAGFVGMYLFKAWGRALSLIVAIALPVLGAVAAAAFGNTVDSLPSSSFAAPAAELAALAWGAVLALAYFSSVGSRFRADGSSESRPVRGVA